MADLERILEHRTREHLVRLRELADAQEALAEADRALDALVARRNQMVLRPGPTLLSEVSSREACIADLDKQIARQREVVSSLAEEAARRRAAAVEAAQEVRALERLELRAQQEAAARERKEEQKSHDDGMREVELT